MGLIGDKINEQITEALLAMEHHSAQIASGLAEWQNGNRLTGARPVTLNGHARVVASPGRLVGWSVYADGGAVTAKLLDARGGAEGDTVAVFALAAGEDSQQWLGPGGVSFGEGLWLEVVTGPGTLAGTVYTGARD